MKFDGSILATEWLRRADSVAKAVDLWVRRWSLKLLCESAEPTADERQDYAAGLLEGLTEYLDLSNAEYQAAVYGYSLRTNREQDALVVTREMLSRASDTDMPDSYKEGLVESQSLSSFVTAGKPQFDRDGYRRLS